jgi:hypothetical protein
MNKVLINRVIPIFNLLFLLILTFFRENLLLSINANIAELTYNRAYDYWFSELFTNMTIEDLFFFKWTVTLSFSVVMSLVTIISLHLWFQNKSYTRLVLWSYGSFAFLIVIISIVANFFDGFGMVYRYLRMILSAVLSPIPLFSFFAIFYYFNQHKENI